MSIRRYSGEELGNIQLGQSGFDMLVPAKSGGAFASGLDASFMVAVPKGNNPRGVEAIYNYTGALLDGAITSTTATTFDVNTGDAALGFLTAGTTIVVTADQGETASTQEIMHIDSVSSDELTVTRGYLGTTAITHSDNAYVGIYKEVPGFSHWISIKNLSYDATGPIAGVMQAVQVNENPAKFLGTTPTSRTHPAHLVHTVSGGSIVTGNTFNPDDNGTTCTISGEDTAFGRFIKVAGGTPASGAKTILQLTRGYK